MPPVMKEGSGALYRLSPNEEAQLLKAEREKRRKLRLIQVREQANENASRLRAAVKDEKNKQLQKLARQIQNDWTEEKEEKLRCLDELYTNNVHEVGHGHGDAQSQECVEGKRRLLRVADRERAERRHQAALDKLRNDQLRRHEDTTRQAAARQAALEAERERAAHVAARPPPPPNPVDALQTRSVKPVKLTDMDAFSSTHFHISELCDVERAGSMEQGDAKLAAEVEQEKVADKDLEKKRDEQERLGRARVRHARARSKELLKMDYDTMLHDLSVLQREDTQRRINVVATIPKQIFLPPHRRLLEKEDQQRDMEAQFEDMYMGGAGLLGDLSLALDPHPLPETPVGLESLDLSTPDLCRDGGEEKAERSGPAPAILGAQAHSSHKTPDGLRRLLTRIRCQRDLWMGASGPGVPGDPGVPCVPADPGVPGGPGPTATTAPMTFTQTERIGSRKEPECGATDYNKRSGSGGLDPRNVIDTPSVATTLEEGTLTPSTEPQPSSENIESISDLSHPFEEEVKGWNLPPAGVDTVEGRRPHGVLQADHNTVQRQVLAEKENIAYQKECLERRLREIDAHRQQVANQLRLDAQQLHHTARAGNYRTLGAGGEGSVRHSHTVTAAMETAQRTGVTDYAVPMAMQTAQRTGVTDYAVPMAMQTAQRTGVTDYAVPMAMQTAQRTGVTDYAVPMAMQTAQRTGVTDYAVPMAMQTAQRTGVTDYAVPMAMQTAQRTGVTDYAVPMAMQTAQRTGVTDYAAPMAMQTAQRTGVTDYAVPMAMQTAQRTGVTDYAAPMAMRTAQRTGVTDYAVPMEMQTAQRTGVTDYAVPMTMRTAQRTGVTDYAAPMEMQTAQRTGVTDYAVPMAMQTAHRTGVTGYGDPMARQPPMSDIVFGDTGGPLTSGTPDVEEQGRLLALQLRQDQRHTERQGAGRNSETTAAIDASRSARPHRDPQGHQGDQPSRWPPLEDRVKQHQARLLARHRVSDGPANLPQNEATDLGSCPATDISGDNVKPWNTLSNGRDVIYGVRRSDDDAGGHVTEREAGLRSMLAAIAAEKLKLTDITNNVQLPYSSMPSEGAVRHTSPHGTSGDSTSQAIPPPAELSTSSTQRSSSRPQHVHVNPYLSDIRSRHTQLSTLDPYSSQSRDPHCGDSPMLVTRLSSDPVSPGLVGPRHLTESSNTWRDTHQADDVTARRSVAVAGESVDAYREMEPLSASRSTDQDEAGRAGRDGPIPLEVPMVPSPRQQGAAANNLELAPHNKFVSQRKTWHMELLDSNSTIDKSNTSDEGPLPVQGKQRELSPVGGAVPKESDRLSLFLSDLLAANDLWRQADTAGQHGGSSPHHTAKGNVELLERSVQCQDKMALKGVDDQDEILPYDARKLSRFGVREEAEFEVGGPSPLSGRGKGLLGRISSTPLKTRNRQQNSTTAGENVSWLQRFESRPQQAAFTPTDSRQCRKERDSSLTEESSREPLPAAAHEVGVTSGDASQHPHTHHATRSPVTDPRLAPVVQSHVTGDALPDFPDFGAVDLSQYPLRPGRDSDLSALSQHSLMRGATSGDSLDLTEADQRHLAEEDLGLSLRLDPGKRTGVSPRHATPPSSVISRDTDSPTAGALSQHSIGDDDQQSPPQYSGCGVDVRIPSASTVPFGYLDPSYDGFAAVAQTHADVRSRGEDTRVESGMAGQGLASYHQWLVTGIQDGFRTLRSEQDTDSDNAEQNRSLTTTPVRRLSLASQQLCDGTGISDEPDLTLISIGSCASLDTRLAGDDTCTDPTRPSAPVTMDGPRDPHKLSPETESFLHDNKYLATPAHPDTSDELSDRLAACAGRGTDQEDAVYEGEKDENQTALNYFQGFSDCSPDQAPGVTLQEALARKKAAFLERSHRRLATVRANTTKSDMTKTSGRVKPVGLGCQAKRTENTGPLGDKVETGDSDGGNGGDTTETSGRNGGISDTLTHWKKTRGLAVSAIAGKKLRSDPTRIVERTSEDRKKSEKEMKERTAKLYGRLEEVRQRQVEIDRQTLYARNRQRAKAYHENLHAKVIKKKL